MSLGFGPHDFDCPCARCESRRENNRQAWARLSEAERERQLNILADDMEEAMMEMVADGRAEIAGHNEKGHTLFRFTEAESQEPKAEN